MIGPYPPPYGGIAVVVRDILASPLSNRFEMKVSKKKPLLSGSIFEHLLRFLVDISQINRDLKTFQPHIVHIHTSYDGGWVKHVPYVMLSKLYRKKVALHLHAYSPRCAGEFPKKWFKRYLFPPKLVLNLCYYIFTLSPDHTQNITGENIATPVRTIENGVLLSRFNRMGLYDEQEFSKKGLEIIYMGNIERRKGIFELMAVMPDLVKVAPDVCLTIAGEGKDKDKILSIYRSFDRNTQEKIRILGRVTEEEKVAILNRSDLFILQSDNEGMPIAILEAMATKCAIISSPVGHIPHIIKNRNGILIEPHSKEDLYNAICNLYNNPALVNSMKKQNYQDIQDYSWENNIDKIAEGYYEMLGGNYDKD